MTRETRRMYWQLRTALLSVGESWDAVKAMTPAALGRRALEVANTQTEKR